MCILLLLASGMLHFLYISKICVHTGTHFPSHHWMDPKVCLLHLGQPSSTFSRSENLRVPAGFGVPVPPVFSSMGYSLLYLLSETF